MAIPIRKLLSELSQINTKDFYFVLSNSYICYLSISKNGKIQLLHDISCTDCFPDILSKFISELKRKQMYYGQEVTVLLAEPISFHLIRNNKFHDLDELRKESNKLFGKLVRAKYQNYSVKDDTFSIAYGYNESVVSDITDLMMKEKVFASHFYPLAGFLLSKTQSILGESKTCFIKLGLISVFLGYSPNCGILYYEKTGDLTNDEKYLLSEKFNSDLEFSVTDFLKNQNFLSRKPNDFTFSEIESPGIKQLSILIGSSKLLVLICLLLALILGTITVISQYQKSHYEKMYIKHEDKLIRVGSLERQISSTELALARFEDGTIHSIQLSAGISNFCQKIPKGVVLDEIYTEFTGGKDVYFSIQGKATRESDVFAYKDYINATFGYDCMRIQSIGKESMQRSPVNKPRFTFTMAGK